MGIFSENLEELSDKLWEDVKKYLKPRSGKKKVILLNSKIYAITGLECDKRYTTPIGKVLEEMQNEGYEILDIKIETIDTVGSTAYFRTLVIYK